MLKLLLTPIYPIWFFLAKTQSGGIMMMAICICHPVIIASLAFPEYLNSSKHEGFVESMLLVSLLLCVPTAAFFMKISDELEVRYGKLGYKTREFNNNW